MSDSSDRKVISLPDGESPWMRAWRHDAIAPDAPVVAGRVHAPRPGREALRPGALGPWWVAGARAAALRPVHGLEALQATPAVVAWLVVANVLVQVLWQRLTMPGPADFHWQGLLQGGLDLAVIAWLCAWVQPSEPGRRMRLLCLLLGAQFVIGQASGLLWVLLMQAQQAGLWRQGGYWLLWSLWLAPMGWWLACMAAALWHQGDRHVRPWLLSVALLFGLLGLHWVMPSEQAWTPGQTTQDDGEQDAYPRLALTEPVLRAQATLLDQQLAALKPQRPGVADVYVLTFAPYGDEEVFRRESAMVADVMAQRFDARGRALQLVNNPRTAEQLPWATTDNLRRALRRIGQVMDPREDVLFIHLTSHGARNGRLATDLWPLRLDAVTPASLKAALDEAGIRHRVVSISACFSGSWIEPLADEDSLLMTAADAEHTSYGCGRRSPLTFFGRAMYDELLRTQTRSFTEAHARARELIAQREQEAGKDDGYSNPQIRVGMRVGPVLEALRRRLDGAAPTP